MKCVIMPVQKNRRDLSRNRFLQSGIKGKAKKQGMILRLWLVCLSFLFVAGCAGTQKIVTNAPPSVIRGEKTSVSYKDNNIAKIPKGSSVYIAYPNEGYDDYQVYPKSAKATLMAINQSFSPYFAKIGLSKSYQSAQSEYLNARRQDYDFFILPRIENWTDSYTLFTGVPDKVSLSLRFYALKTNTMIDAIEIHGESSRLPGYGKTTVELLTAPLTEIAHQIFV